MIRKRVVVLYSRKGRSHTRLLTRRVHLFYCIFLKEYHKHVSNLSRLLRQYLYFCTSKARKLSTSTDKNFELFSLRRGRMKIWGPPSGLWGLPNRLFECISNKRHLKWCRKHMHLVHQLSHPNGQALSRQRIRDGLWHCFDLWLLER